MYKRYKADTILYFLNVNAVRSNYTYKYMIFDSSIVITLFITYKE